MKVGVSMKVTILLSEKSCLLELHLEMSDYQWEMHIPLASGNMEYHLVLHTVRLWQLFPEQAEVGAVKDWSVVNNKTEVDLQTFSSQWGIHAVVIQY